MDICMCNGEVEQKCTARISQNTKPNAIAKTKRTTICTSVWQCFAILMAQFIVVVQNCNCNGNSNSKNSSYNNGNNNSNCHSNNNSTGNSHSYNTTNCNCKQQLYWQAACNMWLDECNACATNQILFIYANIKRSENWILVIFECSI